MASHIKEFIFYFSLLVFIFIAGFTEAEARERDRDYYFGLSGGQTRVKNTQTQKYQDATTFGVNFGLRVFSNDSIWTGAELRYTQTTAKESVNDSGTSTTSTYEVETTGLYFTGRSRGKAYVKARLGAANQVITVNNAVIQDTTRGSYGLGLGLRQGGAVLEIDYTWYGDDVTVVSIGYVFGY
ncbi:MAG: hypothetical protein OEY52_06960 [Gammaproteobacteria bacterium]|nr:hypothetical protein [Gammaproteobacteria bacterium]